MKEVTVLIITPVKYLKGTGHLSNKQKGRSYIKRQHDRIFQVLSRIF
jgi:hypothetical protein